MIGTAGKHFFSGGHLHFHKQLLSFAANFRKSKPDKKKAKKKLLEKSPEEPITLGEIYGYDVVEFCLPLNQWLHKIFSH